MHVSRATSLLSVPLLLALGCGDSGSNDGSTTQTSINPTSETGDSLSGDGDGDGDPGDGDPGDGDGDPGDGDGDGDPDGGTKFDMAPIPDSGDGDMPPSCKVVDDMNAVGICEESAPPGSFEPGEQWTFYGPVGFDESIVTPLVVNLTDDDQNGEIDLCDVPDVIVVAGPSGQLSLYALDRFLGEIVGPIRK